MPVSPPEKLPRSTIGQRTKAYFGLTDLDGRATSTASAARRQVALTVAWLLAGILIWIFWSVSFGRWLVIFGLMMLVIVPIVRKRQRKADQRRGLHS